MSKRSTRTTAATLTAGTAMAAVLAAAAGCGVFQYATYVVAGGERPVTVTAAYRGMENKSFAVLVAADEYSLFRHPQAQTNVCRAVSIAVAARVAGTQPMDPVQLAAFQRENPFWPTSPPGDLIERLGVDRLLLVSLVDYRLHERGNAHMWRGTIVANVDVIEADASDPNNSAYRATVKAVYPADTSVGMLNANDRAVELRVLEAFGRNLTNLFVDHEVMR